MWVSPSLPLSSTFLWSVHEEPGAYGMLRASFACKLSGRPPPSLSVLWNHLPSTSPTPRKASKEEWALLGREAHHVLKPKSRLYGATQ